MAKGFSVPPGLEKDGQFPQRSWMTAWLWCGFVGEPGTNGLNGLLPRVS